MENGVGYVKKNLLNGLKIPDFSAINPAARHWLDTISNVRIHGETHQKPIDLFGKERPCLNPVPIHRFDIGTVSQVRASSQFRITLDTNRQDLAKQATKKHWSHIRYLEQLAEQETTQRRDRATERRIRAARFPVIKTLDEFNWSWPSEINRLQVQNLFRLQFIETKSNVIFLGGVGLGKTHLASALGYTACLNGNTVLFTTAIDIINTLAAAREAGRMKQVLKKYTRPSVLLMDKC